MIPKKIYLRKEELDEQFMCERMVSCDAPIGSCHVEYTDISQVWHPASEEPKDSIDEYGCGKDCLIETMYSTLIEIGGVLFEDGVYCFSTYLRTYTMDEIKRWAYVDDLLPKYQ